MKAPFRTPRATYRLQLHSGFNFEQLAGIVPYLDELGISDIYTSPLSRATPGSQHGYDVCDHNEINPELGGIEGLTRVSSLLRERNMGLLVDFVPNHMGIGVPFNWRWMDVLEHGHQSRFAPFFDIEWNPRQSSLQERVLVPMLHDFYGRVLEMGEIQLRYEKSAFWVAYRSLRFPVRPESYSTILQRLAWFKNPGSPLSQKLEKLAEQFRSLPPPSRTESVEEAQERHRQSHALRNSLTSLVEEGNIAADLEQILSALNGNPADPASFDNLHQILEEQHYRLAFWKSGTHEINYRRFFAIDTLIGLHMETPEVFDECHRLLNNLIGKGIVTGVRVDHIDGLWNPGQYLDRLSQLGERENGSLYVLVEKILNENELLPDDWKAHGTTGYDFASSLINLFMEGENEPAFTHIYHDFSGLTLDPHEQSYQLKLFTMEELFSNAIEGLALELEAQVKSDRRWRDWTVNDLRLAISRIIACLSVYRTYLQAGQKPSEADANVLKRAVAAALRRNRSSDPIPFLFLLELLTGRYPDARTAPELKAWADQWIGKLQQFTGAIMAKSVEDTLFYRYVRLFAANEVGHHPAEFGRAIDAFHADNQIRLQHWPASMLGTSTHDTKMSEDVRARLLALSEMPERWGRSLAQWRACNRAFKTPLDDLLAPDANEEYLLYQVLLGAWPLGAKTADDKFRERIRHYMHKALAESKANTNWVNPNNAWLRACDRFVDSILDPKSAKLFWDDFLPFAEELSWRGMSISLGQVLLKLTAPGVPDFYQGNELWDFSLVDPDNRRPVDYALRTQMLKSLKGASAHDLHRNWQDGRIKMHLIQALLHDRRKHPELFSGGSYQPLEITGQNAGRFVAFLRQRDAESLLVIALIRLGDAADRVLHRAGENTFIQVPEMTGAWHDLLSPREWTQSTAQLPVDGLLNGLPIGVFHSMQSASGVSRV